MHKSDLSILTVKYYLSIVCNPNLIGRKVTAPTPVSSPSSVLPASSPHCPFIPQEKIRRGFLRCHYSSFFFYFFKSLKLRSKKLSKWRGGGVYDPGGMCQTLGERSLG
jgi:hypothetical protein